MDNRAPQFDPSQPGIRQLQSWIRDRTNLAVQLLDGTNLTGVPRWVDADFLALDPSSGGELMLVNRHAIALLRALL